MNTHELKYCPRCHSTFECKSGNILLCQCNKVILDDRVREYLFSNYKDCLCATCMEEIKNILKSTLTKEEIKK